MTITPEHSATVDRAIDTNLTLEGASPAPILITEQEVAFGTAAAVPFQPTTNPWWTDAIRVVAMAICWIFRMTGSLLARRRYPPRLDFLEGSITSRELHRL